LACFAEGTTRLQNVPQARLKETDRIAVMHGELEKMGAQTIEMEDGLIIKGQPLQAAQLHSHGDHRIAMALSIAAAFTPGKSVIHDAQAVNVTFPAFFTMLRGINAKVSLK
ncbi:MAG TPA: 3-phosphoshikimate 1-carboxyvinyltransferase, partial [Spirochaetia bacterium]|nr:3-phosphoshikimate 1-carboxyvinyltransferase [Spirochaetia bacterium]